MDIETRFRPRIPANWPAVVKTPQGSLAGEIKDISVDGVFVFFSEKPELDQRFSIFLNPSRARSIPVIAETRWSGNLDVDDRAVFGMGVRFIAISPEDQAYIATVIEEGRSE
jgi:hypothetical protein